MFAQFSSIFSIFISNLIFFSSNLFIPLAATYLCCHVSYSTDFIQILFPVHQENTVQLGGDGHWFTFAVNMPDKKFQIIDSLRNSDNTELRWKANQVRAKVITLWNKYTSKVEGCKIPTIYNFETQFIEGYKQFGM